MAIKLTPEKLQEIGSYVIKGMTEKEACILIDFDYNEFLSLKESNEHIRKFIERTIVKFKLAHIETIQSKRSDKNSMYLLEKLRPDEFGSKSKGDGPTINIIKAIINEIQNDNTTPIIATNRNDRQQQSIEDDKPKVLEVSEILK